MRFRRLYLQHEPKRKLYHIRNLLRTDETKVKMFGHLDNAMSAKTEHICREATSPGKLAVFETKMNSALWQNKLETNTRSSVQQDQQDIYVIL